MSKMKNTDGQETVTNRLKNFMGRKDSKMHGIVMMLRDFERASVQFTAVQSRFSIQESTMILYFLLYYSLVLNIYLDTRLSSLAIYKVNKKLICQFYVSKQNEPT